jgi:hypothetical protein
MAKNNTNIDPNLLLVGGGLLIAFLGGKAIFEKLGLVDSAEEKQAEAEIKNQMQQLSTGNYFDPDFYKKGGAGTMLLTMSAASSYAKIIYDAKGILNDDEAAVYGVFQSLKTRSQVSFLSEVFFKTYKKSLIAYLMSFLNDSELAIVAKICNRLPDYKI